MKHAYPKQLPPLSTEQQKAREGFMQLWHEILPNKYGIIENFNHGWVAKLPHPQGCKTLEIGAGLGAHMAFENLKDQDYYGLELRRSFCDQLSQKMPPDHVICSDIQKETSFPKGFFDRIIAIHVLEHMPALPDALREIKRILKPGGFFDVVIPCEGGLAYSFARKISAQRVFEKRFKMSYKPIIANEHVSTYPEIIRLLEQNFLTLRSSYFPLKIPTYTVNLCLGLRLQPRS